MNKTEQQVPQQAAYSPPQASGILQRKCECGQHKPSGGKCGSCEKNASGEILQRAAHKAASANEAPSIVHDVLGSHGQPLDSSTRAFMGPRFGNDFSRVPVRASGQTPQSILQLGGAPGAGAGAPAAAPPPAFPTATLARFVTAGPVHCCRIGGDHGCPAHLGPSVAGDPRNQNGMNLAFTIAGHRPTVEYGFVQVISSMGCNRASAALGGGWAAVDQDAPGTDDSPAAGATCTSPNAANEITMTDAPGFAVALGAGGHAGVDEMSMRMNATDWVIAREKPGGWKRISDLFAWHTINRIRRNAAGNWELFPGGSAIGQGYTRTGGCPPP